MDESQDMIYEESEVLWAKIRGYPWWPAYVSDVHEADAVSDYEYTVIFFGDNTNSRLGPSKLRKFPEHYSECYLKAKTNKKLRQSIEKAQQRLSQNQQDVSIYENIRNELNFKRKKGAVSQSRLSSSEKGDGIEAPDLVKHKTEQPTRGRKSKQTRKEMEIFQQQSQNSKRVGENQSAQSQQRPTPVILKDARRRRSERPDSRTDRSPPKQQMTPVEQQTPENRRRRTPRSKQIIQSSPMEKQRYSMRSNQKSKQKIQQQPVVAKEQSEMESEQKQQAVARPAAKKRGRKGRPPKIEQKQKMVKQSQQQDELEQEPEPQSQAEQQPLQPAQDSRRNRKRIVSTVHPTAVVAVKQEDNTHKEIGTLTQKQAEKIQKNLSNRKQLTKILLGMPINTGNIKQILDLGASLALQEGPITKNIHLLLNTLKATLLHKYFPDNSKHRKKYEKMTKEKKKAIMDSESDRNQDNEENGSEDDNNNMKDEKGKQKEKEKEKDKDKDKEKAVAKGRRGNKQNNESNRIAKTVSIEDTKDVKVREIRKKANWKLQKMIRKAGISENAKQYASKIENTFQSAADANGDSYRSIAYQRMRNLKTRLLQFVDSRASMAEVKAYLEQTIQSYESKSTLLNSSD